jgi:hypothetical protein
MRQQGQQRQGAAAQQEASAPFFIGVGGEITGVLGEGQQRLELLR